MLLGSNSESLAIIGTKANSGAHARNGVFVSGGRQGLGTVGAIDGVGAPLSRVFGGSLLFLVILGRHGSMLRECK